MAAVVPSGSTYTVRGQRQITKFSFHFSPRQLLRLGQKEKAAVKVTALADLTLGSLSFRPPAPNWKAEIEICDLKARPPLPIHIKSSSILSVSEGNSDIRELQRGKFSLLNGEEAWIRRDLLWASLLGGCGVGLICVLLVT